MCASLEYNGSIFPYLPLYAVLNGGATKKRKKKKNENAENRDMWVNVSVSVSYSSFSDQEPKTRIISPPVRSVR